MRNGFASVAVDPAIKSYTQTYGFLQQEGATESHRPDPPAAQNSPEGPADRVTVQDERHAVATPHAVPALSPMPQQQQRAEGVKMMDGERVVFVEEGGPSQYLKVVASGDLDENLLEALEDYIKRQKRRLSLVPKPAVN